MSEPRRDVFLREAIILYNPKIAGLPPVAVVPVGYDNDAYRKVRGACVVRASDGKRMSETVRGHVMPQRPEER